MLLPIYKFKAHFTKGLMKGMIMPQEMTFSGEELELVMEAFRAAVPVDDPLGEKIMLRYLSTKVALQEEEEEKKPKMGFLR